jgi:hypothetical protein
MYSSQFWVDAPVGVGYSTVAQGGYAPDEDRLAEDFVSAHIYLRPARSYVNSKWGFISNRKRRPCAHSNKRH